MITEITTSFNGADTGGELTISLTPDISSTINQWLSSINNYKTREAYKHGVGRVVKLGLARGKKFPWPMTAQSLYEMHKDIRFYVQEGLMRAATGSQSKTALTNLFNYLVLYRHVDLKEKVIFDTMTDIRMPKDRSERKHKYVAKEDIVEAIKNANDRDMLVIEVLYLCGIRCEELVELQCQHIHRNVDGTFQIEVRGKEGSIRTVPLPNSTMRKILQLHSGQLHNDWPIFGNCYKPHMPVGTEAIRKMLRRLFGKLDLPEPTPHCFRATFATDHLLGGTDVNVVQELLGHSKAETTLRYLVEYLMAEKKQEAINNRSI